MQYIRTVMFGKIELHVNCVDSRFIFDTCSVHFIFFVELLPNDIAVIQCSCGATFSMGECVHKNHYIIARFI